MNELYDPQPTLSAALGEDHIIHFSSRFALLVSRETFLVFSNHKSLAKHIIYFALSINK